LPRCRSDSNLSYAASSSISARLSNYGALYVTPVRANEAVQVILEEVDRLAREPVSEKELEDKIAGMVTRDLAGRQTNQSQAANLVLYEMAGPGWEAEETAVERLSAVTPARIQEVAARYLKNIGFAVLGDATQVDETVFLRK
jgi:predicted Zn-dependent peptidase